MRLVHVRMKALNLNLHHLFSYHYSFLKDHIVEKIM